MRPHPKDSKSSKAAKDRPEAVVLVDFDNWKGSRPLNSETDAEILLGEIAEISSWVVRHSFPRAETAQIRLYGGWIDRNSDHTRRADFVTRAAPRYRRKRQGIRIIMNLAFAIASCTATQCNNHEVIGTWTEKGQDMVDMMIAVDAAFFSKQPDFCGIVIVSNDADLQPAALFAAWIADHAHGADIVWYHTTNFPNESMLIHHGVHLPKRTESPISRHTTDLSVANRNGGAT